MKIETTLSGSFPKLPLEPGAPNVRVIRNRMDQGKATEKDLAEARRETTRRIVALQESAGVDIPVDGQVALTAFEVGCETPRRLPLVDALIAAAARQRQACLVHRDPHFASIPAHLLEQVELSGETEPR